MQASDRVAIVGSPGTGKTYFSLRLGRKVALNTGKDFKVCFLSSKRDEVDEHDAEELGYKRTLINEISTSTDKMIYVPLFGTDTDPVLDQAERVFRWAYERRYVTVIVDELSQVVPSTIHVGPWLFNIFSRGRGLHVGVIASVQDPAYVPRQIFSMSSIRIFFRVTFPPDVKRLREYNEFYNPKEMAVHACWFQEGLGSWGYVKNSMILLR